MIAGARGLRGFTRRWWFVVALAVVIGVGMGLWIILRSLREEEDKTWERILRTGILPVCTDPSWPPFEFFDPGSGRIVGFDRDLADFLAEEFAAAGDGSVRTGGVRVKIVTVAFDSLYDALLAGRCDIVLSALPYESFRTKDVAYSMTYFDAGLVLVIREDRAGIEELLDLEGRAVAVEWGFVPEGDSSQKRFLRALGVRRYATALDALRAVHSAEVDAALVDRISALDYLHECEGLQIVGEPVAHIGYVIPVRPDSNRLLEEINRLLLQMREDGTLEALEDAWF